MWVYKIHNLILFYTTIQQHIITTNNILRWGWRVIAGKKPAHNANHIIDIMCCFLGSK